MTDVHKLQIVRAYRTVYVAAHSSHSLHGLDVPAWRLFNGR